MSTNRKYNNPQDIDISTLVEVLDLFTDFCYRFDMWSLETRFNKFFGNDLGAHFMRKLPKQVRPTDIVELYNSMTLSNRRKFVRLILEDRFDANKDYLTALPLDYRPDSGGNPIFAPFESLQVGFDKLSEVEPILAGQLAQTLTDLTAISFRREGVQS
tara:strand:- start:501 stop:974 length:474 start_codon:yes stop_codon:yes gene_type:complete